MNESVWMSDEEISHALDSNEISSRPGRSVFRILNSTRWVRDIEDVRRGFERGSLIVTVAFGHEVEARYLEAVRIIVHAGLLDVLEHDLDDLPEEVSRALFGLVVVIAPNDDRIQEAENRRFDEAARAAFE